VSTFQLRTGIQYNNITQEHHHEKLDTASYFVLKEQYDWDNWSYHRCNMDASNHPYHQIFRNPQQGSTQMASTNNSIQDQGTIHHGLQQISQGISFQVQTKDNTTPLVHNVQKMNDEIEELRNMMNITRTVVNQVVEAQNSAQDDANILSTHTATFQQQSQPNQCLLSNEN